MFVTVLGVGMLPIPPQSRENHQGSPSSVVTDFIKMELKGVRLMPKGERKSAHFFVQSHPVSEDRNITVVSDRYELRERPTSGSKKTTSTVDLYFYQFYGQLSPDLRFQSARDIEPESGLVRNGLSVSYSVVLTDRFSELKPNGQKPIEVTNGPEWRIENFQAGLLIDVQTAIRYVTEIRDKSNDPVIKKNAAATLAILKKLKEWIAL